MAGRTLENWYADMAFHSYAVTFEEYTQDRPLRRAIQAVLWELYLRPHDPLNMRLEREYWMQRQEQFAAVDQLKIDLAARGIVYEPPF